MREDIASALGSIGDTDWSSIRQDHEALIDALGEARAKVASNPSNKANVANLAKCETELQKHRDKYAK